MQEATSGVYLETKAVDKQDAGKIMLLLSDKMLAKWQHATCQLSAIWAVGLCAVQIAAV